MLTMQMTDLEAARNSYKIENSKRRESGEYYVISEIVGHCRCMHFCSVCSLRKIGCNQCQKAQ